MDLGALTVVATNAALAAGELLKRGFGTEFDISSKEGRQNLVTAYDKLAEKCIIEMISGRFPNHSFLAEESGISGDSKSDVVWIIDPLDGTVNFAHNVPIFSVSIAVAVHGKVECGVVFQPLLNELFVAERGKGSFLNGKKLHVSKNDKLEDAYVATGFPYNVHENPLNCLGQFVSLAKMGVPIRRLGSAALDLSYVAAGRFDSYWEAILQPWDMAAGMLIVQEAGGKVTHYDGKPLDVFKAGSLLSSNGVLHKAMMDKLQESL